MTDVAADKGGGLPLVKALARADAPSRPPTAPRGAHGVVCGLTTRKHRLREPTARACRQPHPREART